MPLARRILDRLAKILSAVDEGRMAFANQSPSLKLQSSHAFPQ